MIQHFFTNQLGNNFSILSDREFTETKKALDGQMKKGARLGLVKKKKQAAVVSRLDEERLWIEQGFGAEKPDQLVRTLIYHFGLHLSLRAAEEHHNLEYGKFFHFFLEYNCLQKYLYIKV